ncbi:hypothetical protein GCM10010259_17390 [Streptomyces daghestanicus]|uniref:Uncharacterized protein n=1 Tax=Streptomyces daghestanicus TaxID=66885 RepID=A0ABQ3Q3H8_9ACTN|nr:hypothetical protein GCM10010240_52310 [Streptomyces griseoviridis]GGU27442.1 hypothetical protein GCM10010259_17390 [Streptomyces daghestanicus]GHI31802.1 hypothetical protein Sdagh_35320 [Streptomyces daghestanicus]
MYRQVRGPVIRVAVVHTGRATRGTAVRAVREIRVAAGRTAATARAAYGRTDRHGLGSGTVTSPFRDHAPA